jgi:uncharacterized protein (TIGR00730 family)
VRNLCVFCGASAGVRAPYAEAAASFAALAAGRGLRIVYGGGRVGLMGTVADAALAAGGEVVGVIPRFLVEREQAHEAVQEMHVVATLHERKARMAALADAFVALPGGLGTLDELADAVTWAQLGLHEKPIGILDVDGYYGSLLAWLAYARREGFVRPEHRELLVVATEAGELLDRLGAVGALV